MAVDRLEFYSDSLADYLLGHEQSAVAEAIRQVTAEEYVKENFSFQDLNNTDKWNELILSVLHKKFPKLRNVTLKDIQWNYNFYRKKLMEGFKAETMSFKTRPLYFFIK